MLVSKTIEMPDGTVKFEGELAPEELDMVLQVGLNWLLQQGVLPITMNGQANSPTTNTEQ